VEGREHTLAVYGAILRNKYSSDELAGRTMEIMAGIMKSIRNQGSERETVFALKALMLTIVTDPQDDMFDLMSNTLKRTITDSESLLVKAEAIYTLGVVTFFGGASIDETETIMSFLLEIVDTEGVYADAKNDAHVITASLQQWGFLATQLEEFDHITDEAISTFKLALDFNAVSVKIAAGENIAMLYEKSYAADSTEASQEISPDGSKMKQLWEPYSNQHELFEEIEALTKQNSKRLSKADKKALHTAFVDILSSLENPGYGPRYSTALDKNEHAYGSRLKIRMARGHIVRITEWSVLLRLKAIRRVLGVGWQVHLQDNWLMEEALGNADGDDDDE
jgi:hypothetical protein